MAERELLHSIVITAPIGAVWAEITKLDGKQRAMMDAILDSALEPGAPLYYRSTDGKRVFVVGRVVAVDPPRLLSHTQRLTMRDDPWTLVTWELAEVDGGTRVTLRNSGWPEGVDKLHKVDSTWKGILTALKQVLENGDVATGLRVQYALMRAFMWAMPAGTKSENVPEPPAVQAG
ncbi:SRPBCC domain-containing protein [Umezawaea endophytica]|uniref:SRPBCC domain-containing protein n=1 Tax=Umezawaea endophytica TaxID=1654476 RepID=A0A9X3ADW1_9PSEU|nr:SRPBCC domain-containing protein [Umezawaea endophytica]MCS7476597.1 SRPBCC domain-containing protein [Umezawaea endophytica]